MKFKIQIVTTIMFMIFSSSYAQELSKIETKILKNEIKTLLKNPSKYKMLKESITAKETIINDQTAQIITVEGEKSKFKNRLDLAKDSINLCTTKISKMDKEFQDMKTKSEYMSKSSVDNSGMKYRLQIGKYKEFDISSFLEKKKLLSFEKEEDGTFVYTIGNFETEYDAEMFKSAMRQIGVKDAFVAYYSNGIRIPKD